MATVSDVFAALQSLLGASINNTPIYYQNTSVTLPDTPSPFVYCELLVDRQALIGFGGGKGANLYQSDGQIVAWCFVPRGEGLQPATDLAESIASKLRGYSDGTLRVRAAAVIPYGDGARLKPEGMPSDIGNYFSAAVEAEIVIYQVN